MDDLDVMIAMNKELQAPGLLNRSLGNMLIAQALEEVGRPGWLSLPIDARMQLFGIHDPLGVWHFHTSIVESLLTKFPEETIQCLENYADQCNPLSVGTHIADRF